MPKHNPHSDHRSTPRKAAKKSARSSAGASPSGGGPSNSGARSSGGSPSSDGARASGGGRSGTSRGRSGTSSGGSATSSGRSGKSGSPPGSSRGGSDKSGGSSGKLRRQSEKSGSPSGKSGRAGHSSAPTIPDGAEASRSGEGLIRINKYIARAGVCSRRKADELIEKGLVKVNGAVVTELGTRVKESDEVEVNGRSISPRGHVYILVNKPKNTITTTDDPHDRETVMELIALPQEEKLGLFPVGRLDRDTTGVLLVTNDGDLAHRLMHPRYEITKLYRVRTKRPVKPHELDQLRKGVELDDGMAAADQAAYVAPPDHHEVGLSIHEGRNRQVRRMFEALGHEIAQLERINYAGLTADDVRPGKWRRLREHEIRHLHRQVKLN